MKKTSGRSIRGAERAPRKRTPSPKKKRFIPKGKGTGARKVKNNVKISPEQLFMIYRVFTNVIDMLNNRDYSVGKWIKLLAMEYRNTEKVSIEPRVIAGPVLSDEYKVKKFLELLDYDPMESIRKQLTQEFKKGSHTVSVVFLENSNPDTNSIGVSVIKEEISTHSGEEVRAKPTSKTRSIIFIANQMISSDGLKYIREMSTVEIWYDPDFLFSLPREKMSPYYEVLSEEEKSKVIKTYDENGKPISGLYDISKLPYIFTNDPAARYYRVKAGDIMKITYKTQVPHKIVDNTIEYRLVKIHSIYNKSKKEGSKKTKTTKE